MPDHTTSQPTVLTIAGSDPSGGAGIQADIKTIQAHEGYATSVITALTAQNTLGVEDVMEVGPEFLGKQISCLVKDLPPAAIKTGMLASSPIINQIITSLSSFYTLPTDLESSSKPLLPPLIVDPVSVSTSRHTLLSPSAIDDLVFRLSPLATVVTPNALEAEMILGCIRAGRREYAGESSGGEGRLGGLVESGAEGNGVKIETLEEMISGAGEMLEFILAESSMRSERERGVLLKGGHVPFTQSRLREEMGARRTKELDGEKIEKEDVTVEWSGAVGGLSEDAEDTVEILQEYRRKSRPAANGDAVHRDEGDVETEPKYIVDVLVSTGSPTDSSQQSSRRTTTLYIAPFVKSTSTHGTGCTLSAAIASNIAHSKDLRTSVAEGIEYVQYALSTAEKGKGAGNGPLNHQCMTVPRTLPLPTTTNPHPFLSHLLRQTRTEWRAYVKHPFIVQLGQGTLPLECFRHYIVQDWHYLKHYARAHALAASKCTDFEQITAFSNICLHIAEESAKHVEFCETFGISLQQLQSSPESPANIAYSRFILDVGHSSDVLELEVAVFSCLVGYGEVGLYLKRKIAEGKDGFRLEGNPYSRWIEDYEGEKFQGAVSAGIANLEAQIRKQQPSAERLQRLVFIWRTCVNMETAFWQMGLDQS